ncbi:MAG: hypothetical protein ABEI74_03050 [Candidatus Pacearchaeota archaeon]
MKKSFFVMVLVFFLAIVIFSVSITGHKLDQDASYQGETGYSNDMNYQYPHIHFTKYKDSPKGTGNEVFIGFRSNELYKKGGLIELYLKTSGDYRYNGTYEMLDSKTSTPYSVTYTNITINRTTTTSYSRNPGYFRLKPDFNGLDRRETKDRCISQNYFVNETSLTDPSLKTPISCIANYSSDSRCYRGACQSCIDYDSSDGLSGNYTDKGITWNESYSFRPLEGKEDKCINSTHLNESYCNPNDPSDSYITTEVVNCQTKFKVPHVCKDGECHCNSKMDYKKKSCTSDELATLWDANCQVLDSKQVSCDYNNMGVVGDAIPFDSVKIDGKEYNNTKNYTDTGTRDVEIMENGDFVRLDWDTKDNGDDPAELGDELNLEAIDFSSSRQGQKRGYIFVNNLSRSKTVLFDKFTDSNEVCVKDSEGVDSLNDFSDDCTGSDEVKLNCPGSSQGYSCEIAKGGSHYKVWPLKHSGVVELTGSRINTNSICLRSDLNCNPSDWSNVTCNNGTKSRNCNIKQGVSCSGGIGSYETTTCSGSSNGSDVGSGLSGSGTGDVDATSDNLNNTCTRDDWRCTSWGDCSDGTKERVCSKKFDSSCSGGTVPEQTSSEGCDTGESEEVKDTTQSSDGLPSWALAAIIGGVALIVAIIVFFIVAKSKK